MVRPSSGHRSMCAAGIAAPCPLSRDDGRVPTPPRRPWTHDASPYEIESRDELEPTSTVGRVRGLTILGLRLDLEPPDLTTVDVTDALFVGCTLRRHGSRGRRGANGAPASCRSSSETPYPTTPVAALHRRRPGGRLRDRRVRGHVRHGGVPALHRPRWPAARRTGGVGAAAARRRHRRRPRRKGGDAGPHSASSG